MGWLEDNENYLSETNAENQALKTREQMKQQEKENFVDNVLSDKESKEQLKEQLGEDATDEEIKQYLEENYESFIPEQYVVRGARLFCSCGSHERKLNVFKDHAVYTESFPMVHELDRELEKNITFFGVCSSGDPLLNSQNIKLIKITYDEEGNPIEDVVSGAMCIPFIIGDWRDTKQNVKIIDNGDKDSGDKDKYREDSGKGYKAVTTKSFLICRYGGIIEPLDSGQIEIEGDQVNQTETPSNDLEAIEKDFCNIMKDSYGFNEEQAKLIKKSYDLFKSCDKYKNLSRKEEINTYFQNIAAIVNSYSSEDKLFKQFNVPYPKEVDIFLSGIGLSSDEIKQLRTAIVNQHELMYNNTRDFAHEMAIWGINSSDNFKKKFADLIKSYTNVDVNNLISYKGDVFSGSMGIDDMNSDLDATNIYQMLINSDEDLLNLIAKYNKDLLNNNINRAEEFLKFYGNGDINKGMEFIKQDLLTVDMGAHYISCRKGIIGEIFMLNSIVNSNVILIDTEFALSVINENSTSHVIEEKNIKKTREEFLKYLENELYKNIENKN